jgi:hypothetical protein
MRMLIVALVLCASVAEAQTVRALAFKRAWDIVPVGECQQPSLPANIPVKWIAQVEDRLAWCVTATTAAATASDYALYVDGEKFPLLKACISTTQPDVQCLAGMSPAIVAKLTPTGQHRLNVTRTVAGVESLPSVELLVETPGCNYTPPGGVLSVRPIGATIGGPLTTGGLQSMAERIGAFRRDGWYVQWNWDSDSNTVALMMWCTGVPQ